MKYIINMICAIYKINNKSILKTIYNRCITCNESPAVIISQSDYADYYKKARTCVYWDLVIRF